MTSSYTFISRIVLDFRYTDSEKQRENWENGYLIQLIFKIHKHSIHTLLNSVMKTLTRKFELAVIIFFYSWRFSSNSFMNSLHFSDWHPQTLLQPLKKLVVFTELLSHIIIQIPNEAILHTTISSFTSLLILEGIIEITVIPIQ